MSEKFKKYGWFLFLLYFVAVAGYALSLITFYKISHFVSDQAILSDLPTKHYTQTSIKVINTLENDQGQLYSTSDILPHGSIITHIDDIIYSSFDEFWDALNKYTPNDTLKLTYFDTKKVRSQDARVKRAEIPDDFIIHLQSAILVSNVYKDGSSDRSGIQVGDIIVMLNGHSIFDSQSLTDSLQNNNQSQSFKYTIIRDNEFIEIDVELAKYGISLNIIANALAAFIFILIALYIGTKRPYIYEARLVSSALILFGLLLPFSFGLRANLGDENYKIIRYVLFLTTLNLSPAILIHSLMYFPYKRTYLTDKIFWRYSPYIIGLIGFSIGMYNLEGMNSRLLSNYFGILALFFFYPIIFLLFKRISNLKAPKAGRELNFALIIIIGASIFLSLLFILILQKRQFFYLVYLILTLIPLSYIYVIAKYKFFDIELRVRRNIQYLITTAVWKLALLFITLLSIRLLAFVDYNLPNLHFTGSSIEVLDKPLSEESVKFYHKVSSILTGFALVILLFYIDKRIQNRIREKYHRSIGNLESAVNEIAVKMNRKVSGSDLAGIITEQIVHTLKLKISGTLILKNEKELISQKYIGISSSNLEEFNRAVSEKLAESIKEMTGIISIEHLPNNIKFVLGEYKLKYITPIVSRGKVFGIVFLGEKLSETSFTNSESKLISSICGQAAIAVENMLLYQDLAHQERVKHELSIARKIQLASLPDTLPTIDNVDIACKSLPALEVGGDFYELHLYDNNRFLVVIGDVSGKGTSAALYMSRIQGVINTLFDFELSPYDLICKVNKLFAGTLEKSYFITSAIAEINTESKKLQFVRAGHLPLYIYNSKDGTISQLTPKGMMLGFAKSDLFDKSMQVAEIDINSNDILVFITDGIIEAIDARNNEYGEERLKKVILENFYKSSEEIRDQIINSVQEFVSGNYQSDDLTIVVVKIK